MGAQNRDDATPSGAAMEDDPHVTPKVASARVAVGEDQDFGAGSEENQKSDDGTPQLDDSMLPSSVTSPSFPSLPPYLPPFDDSSARSGSARCLPKVRVTAAGLVEEKVLGTIRPIAALGRIGVMSMSHRSSFPRQAPAMK